MNNLLRDFDQDGFVILDCCRNDLIDQINLKFELLLKEGNYSTNSKIYSYNDKPRVVDAYKKIPEIIEFSYNKKLKDFLFKWYNADPKGCSNILFKYGSEQPLHSDYIHHGTFPELMFCGAWTALEDIKEGAGELIVIPGSHKSNIFKYSDFNLKKPKSLKEIQENYNFYESWVVDYVKNHGLKQESILLKKGQTVVWQANLLHGGSKVINSNLTRKSFVVHYVFDNVQYFYNPTFSFFDKNSSIPYKKDFDIF